MLCTKCNTEVPANSAFCPKCGGPLAAMAPKGPAAPTPAEQMRGERPPASATDVEQQLWKGSYSPKAMIGKWAFAGLVTLIAIVACVLIPDPSGITWLVAAVIVVGIWLFFLAYLIYERLSVEYTLTNQRFVHKKGILRRVTNRIEVIDIDDVTFEQGIVERMFGVGTIRLLSSDTSDPKLTLRGIDNVQHVSNLIDNARRDERRRRGMYIESV